MNLQITNEDTYEIISENLVSAVRLINKETQTTVASIVVLGSGPDEARVMCGSGEIPANAITLLDKYMSARGFKSYKWERRQSNGAFKNVHRTIKNAGDV